MASREVFHFDEFTLEVQERRSCAARKPFACHRRLTICWLRWCSSGAVWSEDELLKRLWPEVIRRRRRSHRSRVSAAQGAWRGRPPADLYRNGGAVRVPLHRCSHLRSGPREAVNTERHNAIRRTLRTVGRSRTHLLSGSYFELPAAEDAFRSAIANELTYAPAHAGWRAHGACRQRPRGAAPGSV